MSSSTTDKAKAGDDDIEMQPISINKNYKLLKIITRSTMGYRMKNHFLEPKKEKYMVMIKRAAWLVQCSENYMNMKDHMDDEMGIRLLSLTQNPLGFLNFEYQNFSRLARSGQPKMWEGTKDAYFSKIGDFSPLSLLQLAKEIGITFEGNTNSALQTVAQRNVDKFRILFGTEFNVEMAKFFNRFFTDSEKQAESETYGQSVYAVWIGPSSRGKYREFRLNLTNLYKPKILSELTSNFVIALAQMLLSAVSESMCEGAQSLSTLLRSVTSTNAEFLIAAALSPYQALNRFLVDNFTSFQDWTVDVDLSRLTITIGETRIIYLPDIHINTNRNSHSKSLGFTLKSLLDDATTSVSAQYCLVKFLRWLSLNHKINPEYDEIIDVFNCSTKQAFAVSQMIERTQEIYGSIPQVLIDLLQNSFYFEKVPEKSRAIPNFLLERFISPKNAPITIRVSYLDLFLKNCERVSRATLAIVNCNGRAIRAVFNKMSEEERDIVVSCIG